MKTPLHTEGWGVGGFCRDSPPSTGKILTVLYLRATKDEERITTCSKLQLRWQNEEVSECRALCRAPKGLGLVGQSLVDPRTLSQLRNLYETLSIHISLFFPETEVSSSHSNFGSIIPSLASLSVQSEDTFFQHSPERWAPLKPNEEYARLVEPLLSVRRSQNLVNHCQCQSVGPALSPTALP